MEADASTIVRNLLQGQYDRPVRVLALNVEEGWVRDVSEIIAAKVQDVARRDEQGLTSGTRAFVEAHSDLAGEQPAVAVRSLSNLFAQASMSKNTATVVPERSAKMSLGRRAIG
jgi:hypothetical protein